VPDDVDGYWCGGGRRDPLALGGYQVVQRYGLWHGDTGLRVGGNQPLGWSA
jgi:hypothetical protein